MQFEVLVWGLGGVGASALLAAAARGVSAVGLDRFAPGHARGSSHGASRVIRLAYFEHPDYVPLLREAYAAWAELEARTGWRLYTESGVLQIGPPDGPILAGVRRAASAHGLAIDELDAAATERRFPGFRVPDGSAAIFERRAGLLAVEACVRAQLERARALGAEVRAPCSGLGYRAVPGGFEVDTAGGPIRARRLVFAPGAWGAGLLPELAPLLELRRQVLLWFRTSLASLRAERGAPAFLFQTPGGIFYGLPALGARGVKVAAHGGGARVDDPDRLDRALHPSDVEPVEAFTRDHLPSLRPGPSDHAVCMYTMSPDEHFVVDRHPDHPGLAFAVGLSGHGFKLTPTLGRALVDLVLDGGSQRPIGFLSADRLRRSGADVRDGAPPSPRPGAPS